MPYRMKRDNPDHWLHDRYQKAVNRWFLAFVYMLSNVHFSMSIGSSNIRPPFDEPWSTIFLMILFTAGTVLVFAWIFIIKVLFGMIIDWLNDSVDWLNCN